MTIENSASSPLTFAFRTQDAYSPAEAETPAELYDAPLGRRAIARVVDVGIAVLLAIAAQILVVAPLSRYGSFGMLTALFLSVLAPHSLEAAITARGGQSIGKRLAKIRVVRNVDGGAVGFARSFVRTYAPVVIFIVSATVLVMLGFDPFTRLLGTMVLNGVQLVLLWSERARMIADRIAGTRVIDANPLNF
jgi:uncharacterized RDD family membrane protein YckC